MPFISVESPRNSASPSRARSASSGMLPLTRLRSIPASSWPATPSGPRLSVAQPSSPRSYRSPSCCPTCARLVIKHFIALDHARISGWATAARVLVSKLLPKLPLPPSFQSPGASRWAPRCRRWGRPHFPVPMVVLSIRWNSAAPRCPPSPTMSSGIPRSTASSPPAAPPPPTAPRCTSPRPAAGTPPTPSSPSVAAKC